MAFTLFEINAQIEALYGKAVDPDTGEVVDEALFSLLDACEVEREERILYIATRIKSLQAEAAACKNEAKKLRDRAERCLDRAERDMAYIDQNLREDEELKDARSKVLRVLGPAYVDLDGNLEVPAEYRISFTKPNLTKISDALKGGTKFDWATFKRRTFLRIK